MNIVHPTTETPPPEGDVEEVLIKFTSGDDWYSVPITALMRRSPSPIPFNRRIQDALDLIGRESSNNESTWRERATARPEVMYRSNFLAAAWVLGYSWSWLGGFFEVTRGTVRSSADRHLGPELRDRYAYSRPKPQWALVDLWEQFAELVRDDAERVVQLPVELLASELAATTPKAGEEITP